MNLAKTACAAALCALTWSAHAQTFHAGIAGGPTRADSGCIGGPTSCDRYDLGARAWVGVTNKAGLGIELVAQDFGAVHVSGTRGSGKASLQGVGVGAIYEHREGDLSFLGRLGAGRYRARLEDPGFGNLDDTRNKLYWSAGLGYRFMPALTAVVAYDWTEADNRNVGYTYSASMLTFGVQYAF